MAAGVLIEAYDRVRARTMALASPLGPEDQNVQSMPDASPTKWHLAHTTWFFETFVLRPFDPAYQPFDVRYDQLFNSYYDAVGERVERRLRGALSRPTLAEVHAYRASVDEHMRALIASATELVADRIELGLAHEEQHQELILTDVKHALWTNPLRPAYGAEPVAAARAARTQTWIEQREGIVWMGAAPGRFAFDHERPRHRVFLHAFAIAARPVTCREYVAFIDDGGYARASLWLSDGWRAVTTERWIAPLYWERRDGSWWRFTLAGMRPIVDDEPVSHLSRYEADAFARWAGARLPTEAEWESTGPQLDAGSVWDWTASAYGPYPGYAAEGGALGEYNGKFMSGQYVLRGGSLLTPPGHARVSYRNFFPSEARWQASGVRLARDA